MRGDEEGGACAVNGTPGKWVREGGRLVCKPLGTRAPHEPDDDEFQLAGPLSDADAIRHSDAIRREAYEQSVRELQDAWQRKGS